MPLYPAQFVVIVGQKVPIAYHSDGSIAPGWFGNSETRAARGRLPAPTGTDFGTAAFFLDQIYGLSSCKESLRMPLKKTDNQSNVPRPVQNDIN
jgi:hypothetical protein